jgi:hypothetical protein
MVEVNLDGKGLKYKDESERRQQRAKWLLDNILLDNVKLAVENQSLETSVIDFLEGVTDRLKTESPVVTQLELDRLEDAYMWSLPHAKLSIDQIRQVATWCRRDAGDKPQMLDMAKAIDQKLEAEESK